MQHSLTTSNVASLLDRPVYTFPEVDRLLGLHSGTSRRWIDGYVREARQYPPIVREESTGSEVVTWGEFVETRLLSEYRNTGVPMLRMRPAVEILRREFGRSGPSSREAQLEAEVAELTQALGEAAVEVRAWKRSAEGRLGPSRTLR